MSDKPKLPLDKAGRRQTLAPTALAQYLSLDSCDRFLHFYLHKGQTDQLIKNLAKTGMHRALQPFGPLLADLGDRIEAGVISGLKKQGYVVKDLSGTDSQATLRAIKAATIDQPIFLYQAQTTGHLGQWQFEGQADLIRVKRNDKNELEILVADVKATRKDKVSHRLQVAVYVRLLQDMLNQKGSFAHFEGTVVRRDADGVLQSLQSASLFDLEPYFAALDQLGLALNHVKDTPLRDLHYYVNQRCDGCLFNPICMVESADRHDLALIPFLESADKRALVEQGIRTIDDLADLKELPIRPEGEKVSYDRHLISKPAKEKIVGSLSEKWPIGPKLDRLIQRAARMVRRFEPDTSQVSYSFFFDAGRSVLPDEKTYPDLVKIFLDVQTDYLEDRIYLVGAKISSATAEQTIVKMTPAVPTSQSESTLLIDWITAIFQAVLEVAADPEATPIHLYLYNRHDQKALLEALRRHLDSFAAIPALYNLLTETPALTQAAVSFVYDEIKEQRNLASTGHTLQAVATQLGFKWNDTDQRLYYRLFEQGMFDYLLKRQDTNQFVECAARFYSTIPLEYSYAAWDMFRAEDFKPNQRRDVTPYLRVTIDDIEAFQAKRLEALAFIESRLTRKNRFLVKEPLNLVKLGSQVPAATPFWRVLEEFLYIEHFANLQEHLELFGQPILKRIQQGRALLVRCTRLEDSRYHNKIATVAYFQAEFTGTGLQPQAALQLNKIKANDFVVINGLEADGRAWDILRGRLAIIRNQNGLELSLDLTDMTFAAPKNQPMAFRYSHNNRLRPIVGELYTLDEMVDDLNGDKLLEACRSAETNPFYLLLAEPLDNERSNTPTVKTEAFAKIISESEFDQPTISQNQAITANFDKKIFLIQGPPGTGKSHTLGWAVLARIYAQPPLRVAICCQTHNAINIVLQSIASKWQKLKDSPNLAHLRLFKIGEETEANSLAGVEPLDPWEARSYLTQILNGSSVVIGATPGGLYKLMKQYTKNNAAGFWTTKPFDLVVLDEASQMNLPQALLASSWLNENGQLIIVGDHRQMAPILTHGWQDDDRLNAVNSQPYRSVFQYVLDQKFPRVALDQSFRLHEVQAEFLYQQIYQYDNIPFHSRRRELLPALTKQGISAYTQAVLDPQYPIIIIQHSESGSQQANPTEAELIAPLVEACLGELGLDGKDGLGIVVPHRAQKALLRSLFPGLAEANAIDTVERFQGDEREVIILTATASDPDYVLAEAEFLLNPNRLNVALSRSRKKLIVIASQTVFNFLSSDIEIFEQAILWKRLISHCEKKPLWSGMYANTSVKIFGCQAISNSL